MKVNNPSKHTSRRLLEDRKHRYLNSDEGDDVFHKIQKDIEYHRELYKDNLPILGMSKPRVVLMYLDIIHESK